MTDSQTASRPWYYAIPVFGWIAHDVIRGREDNVYYLLVILLTLLVLAIRTWGLVALGLTAVAAVPVIMTLIMVMALSR